MPDMSVTRAPSCCAPSAARSSCMTRHRLSQCPPPSLDRPDLQQAACAAGACSYVYVYNVLLSLCFNHMQINSTKILPARSPCSSTNLSVMLSAMSRNVGRLGWRATCSCCTGVSRLYVSVRSCRSRSPHSECRFQASKATCRALHMKPRLHAAKSGSDACACVWEGRESAGGHPASGQTPADAVTSLHLSRPALQLLDLLGDVHAIVLSHFPHLHRARTIREA